MSADDARLPATIAAYSALDAFRRGVGTREDTLQLAQAYNVCSTLAILVGIGGTLVRVLPAWHRTLMLLLDRVPPTASVGEQRDIWAGLAMHEAQLNVAEPGEVLAALDYIRKLSTKLILLPAPTEQVMARAEKASRT